MTDTSVLVLEKMRRVIADRMDMIAVRPLAH